MRENGNLISESLYTNKSSVIPAGSGSKMPKLFHAHSLGSTQKIPPSIRLVSTLRRGNSSGNAPALRGAGASLSAFPRPSVGTIVGVIYCELP